MTIAKAEATLTAQNTGTDPIVSNSDPINLVIDADAGSLVATVYLQRRFTSFETSTWIDVRFYTSTTNEVIEELETGIEYRLFCKTGGFTSGSGYLRLSY